MDKNNKIAEESNKIAEESNKTKKARLKLKKYLDSIDKSITQESLKLKVQEIHKWISRHAHTRVILKNKNISLFDENKNAAKISTRVSSIVSSLKNDFSAAAASLESNREFLRKKIDTKKVDQIGTID